METDTVQSNIPASIKSKIGTNLHLRPNHPIGIIKDLILSSLPGVEVFDDFSPIVSITSNFDSLLVPEDHVCRSPQDTYYVDSERVLRTHTSAHQVDLMSSGYTEFLVVGDVYRRDEIDRTHYPVFHQMEGVKLFEGADSFLLPLVVGWKAPFHSLIPLGKWRCISTASG